MKKKIHKTERVYIFERKAVLIDGYLKPKEIMAYEHEFGALEGVRTDAGMVVTR